MGTKYMWANVNTKPVQGALFRIFRSEIMGIPVEYYYDVDCRRTHPLLLPIFETERVSLPHRNILEKIAVVVPLKKVAKPGPNDRKISIQGSNHECISSREKPLEKQRSVLGEPKYVLCSKPHCK